MQQLKQSFLFILLFFFSIFTTVQATPIKSMVIFGDSLSDTGNLTHLLKSLKQQEDPSYLVGPLKVYVLRQVDQLADDLGLPDFLIKPGKKLLSDFFDKDAGKALATVINKLFDMPILPGEPYWNNRYSNGILWGEYLANTLGLDTNDPSQHANESFSGSWTVTNDKKFKLWDLITRPEATLDNIIEGKLIPPSLELEIQSHLMINETLNPDTLYFVFTGGNDYMSALNFPDNYNHSAASKYVDNIISSIDSSSRRLLDAGARQMAIFTMPDVGLTPRFVHTSDQAILSNIILMHNQRLSQVFNQLKADFPQVKLTLLDVQSVFIEAIEQPDKYGLSDTSHACVTAIDRQAASLMQSPAGQLLAKNPALHQAQVLAYKEPNSLIEMDNFTVCDNPDRYLFWDDNHPTTVGHRLLADKVCQDLSDNGYTINCNTTIAQL